MPSLDEHTRPLRGELRNRVPKPGSPEFVAASVQAQDRLAAAALRSGARMVALYRALPSECGTASVAAALQAQGCEVCYPAVVPGERALQFRRASGGFVAGALGGGGQVDSGATLARCKGPSVALVFDSQLVPEVPVGDHDRRVGAVCTDLRW